ncbi:MAG: hypothetical protein R6U95_10635 [Bacteroidales bacterium]
MKTIIGILLIGLCCASCNAQDENSTSPKEPKQTNTQSKPEEKVIVNKEYDDDGNIIKYDSTYSYYYSNIEGDKKVADSIFNQFKKSFNQQYTFSEQPFFYDFFFEDSLLHYDFYKKDFFIERYKQNMKQMNQLFMEMDSVKNEFFEKQFPE